MGDDLLGFIRDILLLKIAGDLESEFVTRFQQVTGPVMAKGAEDTAFYCYHRFIALNEVGGDPGRYGVTVDQFHAWCQDMQRHWPKTMLSYIDPRYEAKRGCAGSTGRSIGNAYSMDRDGICMVQTSHSLLGDQHS